MSDKNLSSLLIRAASKITKRIFEAKRKQFYLTRLVQYWVELWGELWVDVVRFFPRKENAFQRKRTKYLPPFETAAILLVFRLLTWRAACVTRDFTSEWRWGKGARGVVEWFGVRMIFFFQPLHSPWSMCLHDIFSPSNTLQEFFVALLCWKSSLIIIYHY